MKCVCSWEGQDGQPPDITALNIFERLQRPRVQYPPDGPPQFPRGTRLKVDRHRGTEDSECGLLGESLREGRALQVTGRFMFGTFPLEEAQHPFVSGTLCAPLDRSSAGIRWFALLFPIGDLPYARQRRRILTGISRSQRREDFSCREGATECVTRVCPQATL